MYENWVRATDDSVWQGPNVNYVAARVGGIAAVWHRCGYGDDLHPQARQYQFGKDSCFDRNRRESTNAGLLNGNYFFPIPHLSTVIACYDACMRYTKGERGSLPWMIDMEDPPGLNFPALMGPQRLANWMYDLGTRLAATWGPGIAYLGGFYGIADDQRFLECYRWNWTANYGTDHDYATEHNQNFRPNWNPKVHKPWTSMGIFQHSGGNGRAPGYPGPVDLDLIDPVCWQQLTNTAPPVNPIPEPPLQEDDDMPPIPFTLGTGAAQHYIDAGKAWPITSQEHRAALVKVGVIKDDLINISEPPLISAMKAQYGIN